MEVLQSLALGFSVALTPENLAFCLVGVVTGTLIGVLPGIGTSGTIAILLPLTFGMDATSAVIMFAGIYYGAQYGGSITAILVAIPGESPAIVTILEGHALAKQGLAGKALGITAVASWVGTTLSIIALMLVAQPLAGFALSFGPPEYSALMLTGLVMLTFLSEKSMPKALLSGCLGLLMGTVGVEPIGGRERFTFQQLWLMDGIRFIIPAMGFFAVAEVLAAAERKGSALELIRTSWRSVYPSRRDMAVSSGAAIRGSVLGFIVGVLPGAGATIASFTAYALEKKISKHPEKFGTGVLEGLVSPEAANNAATGGALVPLLTLGLPGSSATAMMLGAMMMYGLQPGPLLLEQNPQFVWGLIASMYIGNTFLLILNLPLAPIWAAMLRVRYKYLYPFILMFTIVGVYSLSFSLNDLGLLLFFSALGYLMKKTEVPAAPAVLALVLGPMIERSLNQSLTLSHGSLAIFFQRPISAGLMVTAIVLLVIPFVRGLNRWYRAGAKERRGRETPDDKWPVESEPISRSRS